MTSPTTPRDAIGLSERLLQHAEFGEVGPWADDGKLLLKEAATQLDALSAENARLKLRLDNLVSVVSGIESALDCTPDSVAIFDAIEQLKQDRDALQERVKELEDDVRRLHSDKMDQFERAIAAESRATRAEQERDEVLERLKPFARAFELNDCDNREDDDALEVSIKDLGAARDLVLRLAANPTKDNNHG